MSVMKYKDPSTGEVKKVFAPTFDAYTKTETDTLLNSKAPATHASQHTIGGSDPITPADIGAVRKSGDTMTGNLGIFKDAYPALLLKDLTNGSSCKVENNDHSTTIQTLDFAGDENNKRFVAINDRTKVSDLTYGLTFNELVDGAYRSYKIYGEHNKPTPDEIGAVSKSGDTMKGNLVIKTAAVPSLFLRSDGAGYTNIYKNNSSTVEDGTHIQDVDADGNSAVLKLQRYRGVANCLGLELDGNGTLHYIYHTGNKPTASEIGAMGVSELGNVHTWSKYNLTTSVGSSESSIVALQNLSSSTATGSIDFYSEVTISNGTLVLSGTKTTVTTSYSKYSNVGSAVKGLYFKGVNGNVYKSSGNATRANTSSSGTGYQVKPYGYPVSLAKGTFNSYICNTSSTSYPNPKGISGNYYYTYTGESGESFGRIITGSYVGTGSKTKTISFDRTPTMILLTPKLSSDSNKDNIYYYGLEMIALPYGCGRVEYPYLHQERSDYSYEKVAWTSTSVTLGESSSSGYYTQFNNSNVTYVYVLIY